ncbi:STAS domain-containing protein [Endozoicomonas sp. SM1973]|uniref:STAS domain-containing protein n=1 Tax=Spartinivicinus marinus TaxID=2994442 RepID=A0A853I3C2_9GAMM|nr:STAS domain-containing protein [Spartinivicinus marinus]MCX4025271.1 STAS domain-containing protein [Spartinivicinus marinus]NYZ65992.1 STAS domain-containing protein [Spartinivicinus marinus]
MEAKSGTITLGESVDIRQIEQLHNELNEDIEQNDSLIVDCSQVQSIDTAGLQLIIACQQKYVKQNKTFQIINATPVVICTLELLGISLSSKKGYIASKKAS